MSEALKIEQVLQDAGSSGLWHSWDIRIVLHMARHALGTTFTSHQLVHAAFMGSPWTVWERLERMRERSTEPLVEVASVEPLDKYEWPWRLTQAGWMAAQCFDGHLGKAWTMWKPVRVLNDGADMNDEGGED